MNRPLALALFVGGAICITYGVSASDEIGPGFSRIFTRAPTHQNTWLMLGGGLAATAGLAGMLCGARADFLAANRHARMHPRFSVVPHDPAGDQPEPPMNRLPIPVSVTFVSQPSPTDPNSHEK
jgi:hypothetical protein